MEKLADLRSHGNMISFDRNMCLLLSEGRIDFGTDYGLLRLNSAGNLVHKTDSSKLEVQSIMGFSFHFNPEALRIMAEDIKSNPTLRTVNLSSEFNLKAMKDLLGAEAAKTLTEELQLFGVARSLPKEYSAQLLLNEVRLEWNPGTMSFVSRGNIGIGFIGNQPMNVYVDGYIELQRRRSGDLLDIYLKVNDNVWYWFSYFRGILMSYSSNLTYNDIISKTKDRDRRDPKATSRDDYEYMLGLPDRLRSFIRRMERGGTGYNEY
jgi:hypothetical protein